MKNSKIQNNTLTANWIKNTALILFLLLNFFAVTAQENSISGVVMDNQGTPILYADVILENLSNERIYATELSDVHGFFQFSNLESGSHQIVVKYMGIELYRSLSFNYTNGSLNLPILSVDNFNHDMIVTVTANRNHFIEENDITTISFEK